MLIVCGALALLYGLLDVLLPGVAIQWQVRSTARARGVNRRIGRAFQRANGSDPTEEPWNDRRQKYLVRLTGAFLVVFGTVVTALGLVLVARS